MSDIADSIKRGLEEAIEFAKGKDTGAIVHHVDIPTTNVSFIRRKTGLSQTEFARNIGVSVGTLRNWEQGRRQPQGPARVLLALIEKQPNLVQTHLAK